MGRLLAVMLVGALLMTTSGCNKHRRSAYRPVFAAPAPAVIVPASPCPDGDCPPGSTFSPGFDDQMLSPSGSSLTPLPGGEPLLDPSFGVGSSNGLTPTSRGPALEPLRETRADDFSGRATIRSRVRQAANDPSDLFEPPKADRAWRHIVLHHSANESGSYAEIDRLHREHLGTDGCGYHFVIGNGSLSPDGQIEVTQRWSDQKAGAHCRDARSASVNDYGIGICLVGNLENGRPTARQLESAQALVAYLRDRYEIPEQRVESHAAVASKSTICPGKHFAMDDILNQRNLAVR